jgi:hypothetical protein
MNAILRTAWPLPSIAWRPDGRFWKLVSLCALWGPMAGGLPYLWTIVAIPYAYVLGIVPAIFGAWCYAFWRFAPERRPPTTDERALFGAISGALGGALTLLLAKVAIPMPDGVEFVILIVVAHGVHAGAILGALDVGGSLVGHNR